jgi:Domain of unknown function (DUF5063)
VAIEAFVAAARRFVRFVEDSEALSREAFFRNAQTSMLDLYTTAMSLDHGQPTDDADPPSSTTTDEWRILFQRLQRQLEPFDSVVDGSLSDDIADVYRDLRNGFLSYDSGDVDDAVWKWRTEFESHWGRHAAHAIYALQVLRSEYVS